MTTTRLCENSLPKHLRTKVVNTTCYVQNKNIDMTIDKKRLPMNYGEEENPTFHTFIHLDVSGLF